MMFPKGPRFAPEKIPDVPGPNAYNLAQESQVDAYKRGAFLEKTDRFLKEKESEVPGPGMYNADTKTVTTRPVVTAVKQPNADRYATLQRKLEELEKLHLESKKAHQVELDRVKLELARSQKTNTDQLERYEKLKKQNDTYDVRIQEYKKTTANDQAEIKDLRVKLRMADHERGQLLGKQGEAGDAKKAFQNLETKRREELKERDKIIADLEKSFSAEKKKREIAELHMQEMQMKSDCEVRRVDEIAQGLRTEADTARTEAQEIRERLLLLQNEAGNQEEELVIQLEQCRSMLGRVAEEYGRLASSTVAASVNASLKRDHAALQIRVLRLERKLANSEGQVLELANLIRHTKEENMVLRSCLKDTEEEAAFYANALHDAIKMQAAIDQQSDVSLENDFKVAKEEIFEFRRQIQESITEEHQSLGEFYRLIADELLLQYSIAEKALSQERDQCQRKTEELSSTIIARDALCSQLEETRTELGAAQSAMVELQTSLNESKISQGVLETQSAGLKTQMQEESGKYKETLQKERETSQKLAVAARMSKVAEESLKSEIEQLNAELTDTSRFQEAYLSLVEEVEGLLARNALAEEETERLSKFNAEIIGHNNPAQRIMYVDRIRRELAETKQKLLVSMRDKDVVVAENDDLRHEIAMYKSVMVPVDSKPRTHITRVSRPPLSNQNLNASVVELQDAGSNGCPKMTESNPPIPETIDGDMTVDELS